MQGQASDIAIQAKEILKMRDFINQLYVKHCNQDIKAVEAAVERDTFMSANEAMKWGLVDSILTKRQQL